ncbi:PREDICTED: uncharacterized protein LOC106816449 [Priapulus caudatus]|uniref:Uncharacterized protein LOC106816449 n=1 Tax=Priapulus caudatus TaxID=37621 RepID=A0ABM1EWI4_PRICU|nr:PREDICTED: uncharacterized protein LOC106816449 [Priapulus caudatus]
MKSEETKKKKVSFQQCPIGDHVFATISVDFQSWGNMNRGEYIKILGKRMDELCGYRYLFQSTHKIFSESVVYLADGFHDVVFPERHGKCSLYRETSEMDYGEHCHIGQRGGLEGLAQYQWTIFSTIIFDMVLSRYGYKIPNTWTREQCLNPDFPAEEMVDGKLTDGSRLAIERKVRGILQDLRSTFMGFGHNLKLEETWISDSVCTYGKDIMVEGVLVPFSMKKAAKSNPSCNEMFHTIDNLVAAVSSSVSGACYYSSSVVPAAIVSLV